MPMMRQKPGDLIPTAQDVRVSGNTTRGSLTLLFDTPNSPTAVEVPLAILPRLLASIARSLEACPDTELRALGQEFALREIDAVLHQQTPTLRYVNEFGLLIQTSLDRDVAEKLRHQLDAILQHLGPAPAIQ